MIYDLDNSDRALIAAAAEIAVQNMIDGNSRKIDALSEGMWDFISGDVWLNIAHAFIQPAIANQELKFEAPIVLS